MGDIIAGVGNIVGGIMGANAADKAAKEQAQAINNAIQFQQGIYNTAQTNLNPFIGTGTNALASLAQLYGLPAPQGTSLPSGNALSAYQSFTQTPFYQFPLQQGVNALNASGAARGLTLSGGQANALQAYGQNYAGQNFQSYINALANVANLGQTSATALAGAGNQAASTNLQGNNLLGNAMAAGTIGSQNQFNNALSNLPLALGLSPGSGSSFGNTALGNALGFGGGGSGFVDSGSFTLP